MAPDGVSFVLCQARAPLAQLDRASVYGTEGCWFEPSGVYFFGVRRLAAVQRQAPDVELPLGGAMAGG